MGMGMGVGGGIALNFVRDRERVQTPLLIQAHYWGGCAHTCTTITMEGGGGP